MFDGRPLDNPFRNDPQPVDGTGAPRRARADVGPLGGGANGGTRRRTPLQLARLAVRDPDIARLGVLLSEVLGPPRAIARYTPPLSASRGRRMT